MFIHKKGIITIESLVITICICVSVLALKGDIAPCQPANPNDVVLPIELICNPDGNINSADANVMRMISVGKFTVQEIIGIPNANDVLDVAPVDVLDDSGIPILIISRPDGKINASDANVMRQISIGNFKIDCQQVAQTDVTCDGVDDDCDGGTDEDYVADASCGVGYCKENNTPSYCEDGYEYICAPGSVLSSSDTTCDGVDDDCSGSADEDFVVDSSCGVGPCRTNNTPSSCSNGTETSCSPGSPSSSQDTTCNGIDDDCSGSVDEDYVATTCGVGPCSATSSCSNGSETSCTPGSPISSQDTTCDGIDDDCSGSADEDYVANSNCGVGVCSNNTTASSCSNGVETSCTPGSKLSEQDTTCDGVDDDCSGAADEDYVVINCGVGACAAVSSCTNGSETSCTPGAKISEQDTTCDGVDDDCSGSADEDYVVINCGVGACAAVSSCAEGVETACTPGSKLSEQDTTCDGVDDDCSGATDEDITTPSFGVCQGYVITCTGANGWDYSNVPDYENPETSCDGDDNNCNGEADDGLTPIAANDCNTNGVCANLEYKTCKGVLGWQCDYSGITGYEETETSCDSLDNDCDGGTNIGLLNACGGCGTLIGTIGEECDGSDVSDQCKNGTWSCKSDNSNVECVNETEENIKEMCDDNIDNNCDGSTDEFGCSYPTIPPDAGQQKCYNISAEIACPGQGEDFNGQDAQYSRNPMLFTDNGDQTITDNNTSLIWMKCSYGQSGDTCSGSASTKNWQSAIDYCDSLVFAGYDDWRLPSKKELQSIVDYSILNPSINTDYFPNTIASYYWTSTTYAGNTSRAWGVTFYDGHLYSYGSKTSNYYVRCMRG